MSLDVFFLAMTGEKSSQHMFMFLLFFSSLVFYKTNKQNHQKSIVYQFVFLKHFNISAILFWGLCGIFVWVPEKFGRHKIPENDLETLRRTKKGASG